MLEYTTIFFITLEITIRHIEQSTDGMKIISTSTGCTMDSVWWDRCAILLQGKIQMTPQSQACMKPQDSG